MTSNEETLMIALGDQVQAAVEASSVPVVGFVLVCRDGAIEYRSTLPDETMKLVLRQAADLL